MDGVHTQYVHGVDLLERAAFAFKHEEVHEKPTDNVGTSEDVAIAEIDSAGDEGGEECEEEIPKPVGLGIY